MPLTFIHHKKDKITTVGSLTNGWVITYMVHDWKAAAGRFMSGIEIGCSLSSLIQCILKNPPLESVSNYARNVKVPILSRISLCDGLSKGAAPWQSIQACWSTAPLRTTSQSGNPQPDWTESPGCHGNSPVCHIPTIWCLSKEPPVRGGPDRVNNPVYK